MLVLWCNKFRYTWYFFLSNMAGSYLVNVPKLKGRENYDEWAFAAENYLLLEGMDINKKRDEKLTDADDKKAKAKLIMTIDSSLYVHIKEEITAQGVWKRLKLLFDDRGFQRKISLLRHLISIRLEESESMTKYVTEIVDTAQKLRGTGFQITDEWVGCLLLAGLSEKFSPMIMAIEHSGMTVSTDAIKAKLLDMSSEVGSTGTETAFLCKGWQRCKKYSNGNDKTSKAKTSSLKAVKTIRCYKCKQLGHYKNQCNFNKDKESAVFSLFFLNTTYKNTDWYIDSGASAHMITDEKLLTNVSFNPAMKNIVVANKVQVPVLCSGNTQITTVVDGSVFSVTVKNVLCIPNLTTNLLSVSELIRNGNQVIFEQEVCKIINHQNVLVAQAYLVNGVYRLDIKQDCLLACSAQTTTSLLWHRRLGHINSKDLNNMKNGAVEGVSFPDKAEIDKSQCVTCCEGKLARLPFSHRGSRCDSVLEVVHADVCGPMETVSLGMSKYFLLFVDDYSRMAFVYFLKSKSEAIEYFKEFKALVEKQTEKSIKVLRTDNGGEFCSSAFEGLLKKAGIVHQKTNPHTPEQNGLCERLNRTVVERARCLLFDAKLDKSFWAEAVNTTVYLRNRTLASGLNKVPYELWTGRKPDLSHIRVFGSTAMIHIPKIKRTKWDQKAEQCILLGYADNTKGYRLYNPKKKTIITSRDVVIMENNTNLNMTHVMQEKENKISCQDVMEEEKENVQDDTLNLSSAETITDPADDTYVPDDTMNSSTSYEFCDSISEEINNGENSGLPKRNRKPPERYGYSNVCLADTMDMCEDSLTYEEVLSSDERDEWSKAMNEELQSFYQNKAWELVEKPSDGKVVQCKWVYKKKLNSDNTVRYRARLVAKGFTQREGIDYKETFSPVLKYSTLKLLFAISVNLDLNITHLDVTTAFLNGHLDETVFMQLPQNLMCKNNENKVLKLNRAIYGLKQSARQWYKKVDDCLIELNYKKSVYEPCLFIKSSGNLKTFVALFVDDFFIFSNCSSEVDHLKNKLSARFKLQDLGQLRKCLGMNVKIKRDKICIDQEQFIERLLRKFNVENCKNIDTPMEVNLKLDKGEIAPTNYPYQQLIGSLMYLSVLTRPDISYCVSYLSQFNNCNTETHWKHAKRVLKYLSYTKSFGLMYVKNNLDMFGFVDADWASDVVDRRSYTGYCFVYSGCVISHESRKQQTVALSSTEAEYMAVCEASKEAIFLKNLMSELIITDNCPIVLYNDNQSAQKLSENCMYHRRSKHIDVRFHFIRDAVANKLVKIEYLKTSDMPADIFTKSLCKIKHYKFMQKIGVVKVS